MTGPPSVRDFPNDELVRILSRETVWSSVEMQRVVNLLRALGWDGHQIRRGVMLVAGSTGRLSLQALIEAAQLVTGAGGSVDEALDALTGESFPR